MHSVSSTSSNISPLIPKFRQKFSKTQPTRSLAEVKSMAKNHLEASENKLKQAVFITTCCVAPKIFCAFRILLYLHPQQGRKKFPTERLPGYVLINLIFIVVAFRPVREHFFFAFSVLMLKKWSALWRCKRESGKSLPFRFSFLQMLYFPMKTAEKCSKNKLLDDRYTISFQSICDSKLSCLTGSMSGNGEWESEREKGWNP